MSSLPLIQPLAVQKSKLTPIMGSGFISSWLPLQALLILGILLRVTQPTPWIFSSLPCTWLGQSVSCLSVLAEPT